MARASGFGRGSRHSAAESRSALNCWFSCITRLLVVGVVDLNWGLCGGQAFSAIAKSVVRYV